MELDWQAVIDRNPRGYVELNDGKWLIHGPIQSIELDAQTDFVRIKLHWAARVDLNEARVPAGDWEVAPDTARVIEFPNLAVPFVIEPTPEKGLRVRFASLNILYIDPVKGLDPKRVRGLQLETTEEEAVPTGATSQSDPRTICYTIMASMGKLSAPSLSVETATKICELLAELRDMEIPPEMARKYGSDLSESGLLDRLRATGHGDPSVIAMLILDELQKR